MNHLTTTKRAGDKLQGARRRVASRLGLMHSGAASTSCELGTENSELGTRNSELRTRVTRRGVTLLEVLVSMGVIAIGLLGVAAMFPVGASKVQKAVEHDRAAALGQAAFHEIKIRGLLNPGMWATPAIGTTSDQTDVVYLGPNPVAAVAFDPLSYPTFDQTLQERLAIFSYTGSNPNPSNVPRVVRMSAQTSPGSGVLVGNQTARFVMQSHDDLVFDRPDDRDAPAVQLSKVDSASGNNVHRQFEGQFSWMFTAVPQLNFSGGATGRYNVSVVVFHGRLLVDSSNVNEPTVPERMVQVDSTPLDGTPDGLVAGGIGGIETSLFTNGPREYLERIKPGNWVLLSAQTGTTANPKPILKWYRIVSLEDEIQDPTNSGTGPYTRWISLAGSDLPTTIAPYDLNGNGNIDPAQGEGVYISLFDNAIAVYERTMRVEGSSMYSSD